MRKGGKGMRAGHLWAPPGKDLGFYPLGGRSPRGQWAEEEQDLTRVLTGTSGHCKGTVGSRGRGSQRGGGCTYSGQQ